MKIKLKFKIYGWDDDEELELLKLLEKHINSHFRHFEKKYGALELQEWKD